jgi:hypothetical protein
MANCPGCGGELVDVPVGVSERPHSRCPGCMQVYVPHEGCNDRSYRGLHPCDDPEIHLSPAALARIEERRKGVA